MRFKEFVAMREMETISACLDEGLWDVGAGLFRSAGGAMTVGDEVLAKIVGQGQKGRMTGGLKDFAGGLKRAAFGKAPQKARTAGPTIEDEKIKFTCPNGHAISVPKSEHGRLTTCPVCNNGSRFRSPIMGDAGARREELRDAETKKFLSRKGREERFRELVGVWRKTKDPKIQDRIAKEFPNQYKAALKIEREKRALRASASRS